MHFENITGLVTWDMNFRRTRIDAEQSISLVKERDEYHLRKVDDLRDI